MGGEGRGGRKGGRAEGEGGRGEGEEGERGRGGGRGGERKKFEGESFLGTQAVKIDRSTFRI
jgi:hypothetical protein